MSSPDIPDIPDIMEVTDFSGARRNPYADRIRKHGFSVTVHYGPDDVSRMIKNTCERDVDLFELDPEELRALAKYREANQK